MIADNDDHTITDLNPQPSWAQAWHMWTVFFPRRSITGRLVFEKSGGGTTGSAGGTRSSPNSMSIEIIDPYTPQVTLTG
jgi:hypothetical protein